MWPIIFKDTLDIWIYSLLHYTKVRQQPIESISGNWSCVVFILTGVVLLIQKQAILPGGGTYLTWPCGFEPSAAVDSDGPLRVTIQKEVPANIADTSF